MAAMNDALRGLADKLFASIERECPLAWTELTTHGAGLSVKVAAGNAFGIEFSERGPRTCVVPLRADVEIQTDVATIDAVVFGEVDLESAILDDRIVALGSSEDLARLSELIRLVVAGAARAEDAEFMADELSALAAVAAGGDRDA